MKIESKMLSPGILIVMKGADVPSEIQVLPYGSHHTIKGNFVLDNRSAGEIISAFANQKNDMVIDYEHETLSGNQAPAAGWIKKLINKGEKGIWAVVEWTQKAKEYLQNREYRYVSPVFLKRIADNRAIRLINVALTNQPAIDGMVPMVNKNYLEEENDMEKELLELLEMKAGDESKIVDKVSALISASKQESDKITELADKLKTSEATVVNFKAASDKNSEFLKEIAKELGIEDADSSSVKAAILAAKAGSTTAEQLSAKFAALESRMKAKEAEDIVISAMKEGKIIPAQKEWALAYAKSDPKGFEIYVEKAVKLIQFGDGFVAGDKPADKINSESLMVAKQLGIEDDELKKFIKEEK